MARGLIGLLVLLSASRAAADVLHSREGLSIDELVAAVGLALDSCPAS